MHRIVIVGNSGSGKTALARELSGKLDSPHLELDSIHHQPDWEPLPEVEFRARVADFALKDNWIIDGNYIRLGTKDLVWPVADTLIWVDLPLWVVMRRVIARTFRRAFTREELWNNNREPLSNFIDPRPDRNIMVWALTRNGYYRRMYEEALAEPDAVHLRVYRLRSPGEVKLFLDSISGQ